MLRWVLLCDYCSCFYLSRRPLKLIDYQCLQLSTLLIGVLILFSEFCSPSELSLAIIKLPPRALQSSTPTHSFSYCITHFLSYMTRAWGMPASFVHSFIFYTLGKVWVLQVPLSLQWITLDTLHNALSYNGTLSRRNIDEFWLYVCS
jgi:hypothetical protein